MNLVEALSFTAASREASVSLELLSMRLERRCGVVVYMEQLQRPPRLKLISRRRNLERFPAQSYTITTYRSVFPCTGSPEELLRRKLGRRVQAMMIPLRYFWKLLLSIALFETILKFKVIPELIYHTHVCDTT